MGTGIGGIIGPQLFGPLVATGKASEVFKALAIGASLMIVGGVTGDRLRRQGRTQTTRGHRQAANGCRKCGADYGRARRHSRRKVIPPGTNGFAVAGTYVGQ